MDGLTGWDWFVLLVLAVSVLLGLVRGLVRTVFALAAWLVAILGTPLLGPDAVAAVGLVRHPWVVYVVLFLLLFVGVRLLGNLIARGVRAVGLSGADRGLGALLGVARALVVMTLAAVVARETGFTDSESWQLARSRPLLEQLGSLVDIDFKGLPQVVRRA